jgi:anti-anti-sigma regulatory factor
MMEDGVVGGTCAALPAVADLVQAGPLKAEIERHLAAGVGLDLDASAVQRISSPCLQVLVAGVAAFAKAGGPSLSISKPSAAFVETASALGLAGALGLD